VARPDIDKYFEGSQDWRKPRLMKRNIKVICARSSTGRRSEAEQHPKGEARSGVEQQLLMRPP